MSDLFTLEDQVILEAVDVNPLEGLGLHISDGFQFGSGFIYVIASLDEDYHLT